MDFGFHRLRAMDWPLAFATLLLFAIGLASVYSVALSQPETGLLNVKKQLAAAAIGFVLFVCIARANYRQLRNWSMVLYGSGVLSLILVLVAGSTIRGTRGWFSLGAFSVQPVEWMKVGLAVALAAYLAERVRGVFGLRQLIESGVIVGIPVLLVLQQPDLGSASLLVGMWGIAILFAGLPKRYIILLSTLGAVLGALAWQFVLAPYQKSRIMTFLNPAVDPLGQGYNVAQAIIAIGSGGWFGRGLGFGSQSQLKFLPESQTDFVFAVVAEELGLFGVMLVVGAALVLLWRLLILARESRDDFTCYLVVCLGAVLFCQVVVNIGANLGMLPVTGVTLPLVSYGGSSLIFTLAMIGIVQSVAVHRRRL